MDHIGIASQSQDPVHVQSEIDDFFGRFKIATLMHRYGIRKHHGHSVRSLTEHRTFGDLFYACCEEAADISFMQALYRILTLAADQLKQLGAFCEKTASDFFDAIMDTALQCVGLSKNKFVII
jgi:hypothetical protein